MKKHGIGWLNVPGYIPQTWNPIVGCSKISEGCRNCYAERMANRLKGMGTRGYTEVTDESGRWNGIVSIEGLEDTLQKPLGWKKPCAIFVNSMGDLFHENTPDEWIDRVFAVMALCPQHLFIVLTKRAERMPQYFVKGVANRIERAALSNYSWTPDDVDRIRRMPLPNVWLGVTAEDQEQADERIPHLLNTPAAVRFVSCEPLLGPVDIDAWSFEGKVIFQNETTTHRANDIDWIICGGESGAGARTMQYEWAESLRDQAKAAGVPFFFKQWGAHPPTEYHRGLDKDLMLDGKRHHEFPTIGKGGAR